MLFYKPLCCFLGKSERTLQLLCPMSIIAMKDSIKIDQLPLYSFGDTPTIRIKLYPPLFFVMN